MPTHAHSKSWRTTKRGEDAEEGVQEQRRKKKNVIFLAVLLIESLD